MAKTLYEIHMDYQHALQQASELEAIAVDLTRYSDNQMEGCLRQIAVSWKGENASLYLKKGEQLRSKIKDSTKDVKATAEAIRQIAVRTRDAELAALAIAMSRF